MAGGWRVKWLREAEIFVYPTKISVSRNCFSYLPQQVFRSLVNRRTDTSTKCYHQALPPNASSNGGDASRVGAFFSSLVSRREKAINKGSQKALITCLSASLCLNAPTRDASPPLVVAFLLAPNTITKRYHQTLALMGATRLASGHFSAASSRIGEKGHK